MTKEKQEKIYVPLHNHSHYSQLDGYATIDEYVKVSKEFGFPGFGLADHGTASGLYSFIKKMQAEGLIPVPGVEFYVAPENPKGAKLKEAFYYGEGGRKAPKYDVSRGAYTHLTVFAYNNKGLSNLFKLSSMSCDPDHFYTKPRIDTNMLAEHSEGLIVTTGCPSSEVSTRFLLGQDEKAYEYAQRMKDIFGDNYYVEIMDHGMHNEELERILVPKQIKLAKDLGLKLIATNDSHYCKKSDAEGHEHFLAMSTKSKMSEPTKENGGKRFAFSGDEYYIKTYDEMYSIYPEEVAAEALANTLELTEKCKGITLNYRDDLRPFIEIPEGYTEATYLQKLIYDGFVEKRGHEPREIQEESVKRIQEEFKVLHSNDFISYFLVVNDYIQYAHDNNIGVGAGRGCFVPGTRVKANQGAMKKIENIKIGDKVQTHDTTYQIVEDVFTYDVEDEDMIRLTLNNGVVIESTSDHMIFHKQKGFMVAGDFKAGDIVLGPKGRREKYNIKCDSCNSEIILDKQEYDKRIIKGHYKPEGECWCYECVKRNLIKIPAVAKGAAIGAGRQKDNDVKEKISNSLKKQWEENYEERMESWRAYMKSPEYEEYREKRRKQSVEYYSIPENLEKLTKQGKKGYQSGKFISHRQNKKEIYYASSYEQRTLSILETDSDVESFDRCKDVVKYVKPSTGLIHNYLPDFEVVDKNGDVTVIEVKAKWQLEEEDTKSKLKQAEDYYNEKGINYVVWTEDTLNILNDDWHNDFEVVKVEKFTYTGKVHDIQVANVHNYNVEGVTVHNSVGGSEIAYVLDISNTDPIRFELLFERFLSPGRGSLYQIDYVSGESEEIAVSVKKRITAADGSSVVRYVHEVNKGDVINFEDKNLEVKNIFVKVPGSAPDVDTDFHTGRREEVIDYVTEKYGKDKVAQIITFGTFKAKKGFKAMCTLYNIPFSISNKISSLIPNDNILLKDMFDPNSASYKECADFRNAVESDQLLMKAVKVAQGLEGRISENGTHACGVIISSKEIGDKAPTLVRQEDGKVVTQWEYPEMESLGFIKMDFLGLELIDTIQATLENIEISNKNAKEEYKRDVPNMRELIQGEMDDPETYENLKAGNTLGVFQLSSPGVRELLKAAKPSTFMEIANITALYRPGPMKSGSHIQYANRKSGAEEISYIHPDFEGTEVEEVLKETFGLMIFQEQIMLIAGRYAGFTPYETDKLRKAVGKKKMDVMMKMKPKFKEGCLNRGASEEAAEQLWETIRVFGEYGFNKSHSVSYAINIYQEIFLKTHYPADFMAALIQQASKTPEKLKLYIQEATRMKLKIGPVNINTSQVNMSSTGIDPSREFDIVYGFSGIAQVKEKLSTEIVEERNANGPYTSVVNFVERIVKRYKLNTQALENIAKSGAFDEFGVSRKLVAEKAKALIDSCSKKQAKGVSLFDLMGTASVSDSIVIKGEDYSYTEKIKEEASAVGMFLSGHPISNLGHISKMYKPVTFSHVLESNSRGGTFNVFGTVTALKAKLNKSGKKSVALQLDDSEKVIPVWLPKEIVEGLDKGEELQKQKNGQSTSNPSPRLLEILRNELIVPLEPIELNEPYMFTVKRRGYGEDATIQVVGIKRIETAHDGSIPYEVNITERKQVLVIKEVLKKHKAKENGTYVKVNFKGKSEILKYQVQLSLDFIIDMESVVGKDGIVTSEI